MPKPAEPGSHIDVMVTINGEQEKRSYSVVESIDGGATLAISVFKAPVSRGGSVFMHTLEPGDALRITQPLQNFPLRIGAERYVLLAGGIGITAIMNMAGVLRNVKADYTLIYAGRTRPAMAYLNELQELHGDRLQVHVDDEGSTLDVNSLVDCVDLEAELYMCGPIRLMDAVRRTWAERELAQPNLRYETFGNSGWYDPEEFVVRIPRLGVEAKVGQGRSMLEALEDAGVGHDVRLPQGRVRPVRGAHPGSEGRRGSPRRFLQQTSAARSREDVLLRLPGRNLGLRIPC